MYIAQQCFDLSDEGIEDAVYDSQSIRGFVGIDLTHESVPDSDGVGALGGRHRRQCRRCDTSARAAAWR